MRWAILLLVTSVLAGACASDDLDTRTVRSAVVTVEAEGCSLTPTRGVGIAIGEPGIILTVAHTIAGAARVSVIDDEGIRHGTTVRRFDPDADLAVLFAADRKRPGLDLARAVTGDEGAVLTTRTSAGTVAVSSTIEKFISVSIEDIYRGRVVTRSAIEITSDIRRGDSGAGVIDAAGRVTGLVYARSRERPGVAFALDDSEIRRAIASVGAATVSTGRCT